MDSGFTHLDAEGHARMVNVGLKAESVRRAVAKSTLVMEAETLRRILAGDLPKGAVLDVARVAAIAATKRTADLIPMCHPLRITGVEVSFEATSATTLTVQVSVAAFDRTGVEMEAMTGAAVAALTVYDMAKAVDRAMRIGGVELLLKEGGKSGLWQRP
jgi:cyclic pyranopterin phosphate synthase